MLEPYHLEALQSQYGARLKRNALLARYTSARVGGPADALLDARTGAELVNMVTMLWRENIPFTLLGGGSNLLVSDAGIRRLVLLNRARQVRFLENRSEEPMVRAESGANFGAVARQAASRGYSGLEWAGGIPGTIGGAVVGNAGAHGGDLAGNLVVAEILHHEALEPNAVPGVEIWPLERLEFGYRTSYLKRHPGNTVVLAALLRLNRSTPGDVQSKMDEYVRYRRRTQPPGASMGSMFKNPPGDYAGRLIEAAGLKGARCGDAQISELHANFFINLGHAKAADIFALIQQAKTAVAEQFGVKLELEIELVGEWSGEH